MVNRLAVFAQATAAIEHRVPGGIHAVTQHRATDDAVVASPTVGTKIQDDRLARCKS